MSESKERYTEEYLKVKENIEKSIREKKYHEAYSFMRQILDYPGPNQLHKIWGDIIPLLQTILKHLLGSEWEELLENLQEDPTHVDILYDIAYNLYEEGAYSIAATFLKEADKISPNNEKIITELAVNLESLLLNEEAVRVLEESPEVLDNSELCQYLLAFNKLLVADIKDSKKILDALRESSDYDIRLMAESLEAMITRAEILGKIRPMDEKDLRGWHLALNGSILLHTSPYGKDDGMHGRYAYFSDTFSLCRHGIMLLKTLLDELDIEVPVIMPLPDRSSQILASAASDIMNIPLLNWNEVGLQDKGLIVAYDLDLIPSDQVATEIAEHRTGQILWVHASCWTNPFPFSPDITTFLYQHNTPPWSAGRMIYDSENNHVSFSEEDTSSIDDLAEKIVSSEDDLEFDDKLTEFIHSVKALSKLEENKLPGIFRSTGRRIHQRAGSPVKSNRFI